MDNFSFHRTLAVMKKEVYHISRDPFTVGVAVILPMVIAFIFGYAMEFNVKEIPTAFLDNDRSLTSRQLLETIGSSNYFKLEPVNSPDEGFSVIESDRVKAFIYIPHDFEKNVYSDSGIEVQVIVDGTDGSFVGAINGYLATISQSFNQNISGKKNESPKFALATRYLFNQELNSKWFSIPGITVVIMAILCSLLTTLTVAREWENGSMELLLSTPVKPSEIILGKLTPYAVICLFSVILIYILARAWFGVPFVGNHLIFALGCLLFLASYLALGLVISVLLRRQLTALQTGLMVGMLPSAMLSGFIFPIENMPYIFRILTSIFPARWFMDIARDQFLKGSSFFELAMPFTALSIICFSLILLASTQFKQDLEK